MYIFPKLIGFIKKRGLGFHQLLNLQSLIFRNNKSSCREMVCILQSCEINYCWEFHLRTLQASSCNYIETTPHCDFYLYFRKFSKIALLKTSVNEWFRK